ncbi:MAG: ComEC/Rec2 family competence protein [Parvibaculum sp.]|uniref:ComEC/Rec2 family competence protein n=1 Tax=Parvibaculum sp. TaxID=2024848 RepID=UPI002840A184|nr:ComEC/Rec2 family competence protein [Parvibaculum sp.]MDR3498425.1 ComEC/Rec2 family competence protein [Parvibaculum sp.]
MTVAAGEDPDEPIDAASASVLPAVSRVLAFAEASFLAESDRWFLWSPVLLGSGIALYFSLSFEPPLWMALAILGGFVLLLALMPRRGLAAVVVAAGLCIALGFAAANFRTWSVAAPVLQKPWSGALEGRVVENELTDKGALSVTIAPTAMERLAPDEIPARIRLSVRMANGTAEPGETVRLRARLMPPPEPVEPGGFDYARQVWFESLGAVGYAFTAPEHLAPPPDDWTTWLQRLRHAITARVQTGIGGASGAVAAALITGEQRAIPEWAVVALRNAGLAHVLSISGLHMVLFGGSLFWLVRAGFALVPALALRYPIKKWGAAAALAGSTGYLLISGAGVATQRSWIMIALMFVAIILDRPAISMRNVALAAIVVLLWQPESLLGASFHMSFSAVVALIAAYESPFVQRLSEFARGKDNSLILGSFRFAANHVIGILLTTTIAGFATGAYAAFHFDRIAVYGMAGNMGALPIVSAVIMPAALMVLVLMPFGLDAPALWVMGKGVDAMLWVARMVSNWEGADRMVASAPMASLILVTLGGLWLALWRGHWRYGGVPALALGLALWNSGARPDVLIDREGALAAVRAGDGRLALTAARPSYAAEQWLRHDGDARSPVEAAKMASMRCDALGCAWREEGRPIVAFPASLEALEEDCALADVIVTRVAVPHRIRHLCGARMIVDRFDLWREGATALRFSADGNIVKETSLERRGNRPWVRTAQRRKSKKPPDEEDQ